MIERSVLRERIRLANIVANWDKEDSLSGLVDNIKGVYVHYWYMAVDEKDLKTEYLCKSCNKRFWADMEDGTNYKKIDSGLTPVCPNKKCKHYGNKNT